MATIGEGINIDWTLVFQEGKSWRIGLVLLWRRLTATGFLLVL